MGLKEDIEQAKIEGARARVKAALRQRERERILAEAKIEGARKLDAEWADLKAKLVEEAKKDPTKDVTLWSSGFFWDFTPADREFAEQLRDRLRGEDVAARTRYYTGSYDSESKTVNIVDVTVALGTERGWA